MMRVVVQAADFDVSAEMARLHATEHSIGAVVSFTGLVREEDSSDRLISLTLEHYPGMTERELTRIAEEARSRWSLQAVTVIHRFGELKPSDQIVLVLTASAHRGAAFEAAQFLMDYLKVSAPFWKKEVRQSGERWIEERCSDDETAARWKKS